MILQGSQKKINFRDKLVSFDKKYTAALKKTLRTNFQSQSLSQKEVLNERNEVQSLKNRKNSWYAGTSTGRIFWS